jgi:hypothetical protein
MGNGGLFPKGVTALLEPEDKLVRIIPVQIDKHHLDKFQIERPMTRRWIPHFGKYFNKDLTTENLKDALLASNVEPGKFALEQHSDLVLYQYRGKPPIILNTSDYHFYSTDRHIAKYGIDLVQYQAYIIVEILNKNGLSSARRGRARFEYSETEKEEFRRWRRRKKEKAKSG